MATLRKWLNSKRDDYGEANANVKESAEVQRSHADLFSSTLNTFFRSFDATIINTMSTTEDIVLFHYPFSPYARRIVWYLELRGIPYKQCVSFAWDS